MFLFFISGCTLLFLQVFSISVFSSGLYSTWVKPKSFVFPKVSRQPLPLIIAPSALFFLQMYYKALQALAWAPNGSTIFASSGFGAANEVAANCLYSNEDRVSREDSPHWKWYIFTILRGGQLGPPPPIIDLWSKCKKFRKVIAVLYRSYCKYDAFEVYFQYSMAYVCTACTSKQTSFLYILCTQGLKKQNLASSCLSWHKIVKEHISFQGRCYTRTCS